MMIEHIAMYVNDLERAKDLFIRYFEGKAGEKYQNREIGFQSYFISFQNGSRLELMHRTDMADMDKPPARTGYVHIAFSVGTKQQVDVLTRQMENDGYHVLSRPRTTGYGYYESCLIDFEGNQIEITI